MLSAGINILCSLRGHKLCMAEWATIARDALRRDDGKSFACALYWLKEHARELYFHSHVAPASPSVREE